MKNTYFATPLYFLLWALHQFDGNGPDRHQAATLDNTSNGRFIYSRNTSQFGFNGGYYFLNISASF